MHWNIQGRLAGLFPGILRIKRIHSSYSSIPLMQAMHLYKEQKRKTANSPAFSLQIEKTMRYLRLFGGDSVMLSQIDDSYCLSFIDYLRTVTTRYGTPLSPATQAAYFRCFNCALNWAVRKGLMAFNPVNRIDADMKPKTPESMREYLTKDELKVLMAAPCRSTAVKQAYLFACFCGLRFSDIRTLTWGNIFADGERIRLKIVMQKTRRTLYLPLSQEALRWLPRRGDAHHSQCVFALPSVVYSNLVLKHWARENGISKKITFHTSRHTFATMSLQADVDLYTVSKLLGHTQVKTTQIYAKVIDRRKDEAVDALSNMFMQENRETGVIATAVSH